MSDNENEWEVIGIIPASENVADGLNILQHWHEPIEMKGYVLDGNGLAGVNSETCALEGQGHGMIVTSIKTSQGVVSLDGEHDDEYSLGDTDIFGGWTFILFFLLVGVGGGIGLFMVSTMVIRQGAKATAEALLGREGFAKSVQMKKDIKQSKKDGLVSPSQRASPKKKSSPPPKKKKEEDVAIPGFSLDSVLQSDSSDSGQKTFGGGNSVVLLVKPRKWNPHSLLHHPCLKSPAHQCLRPELFLLNLSLQRENTSLRVCHAAPLNLLLLLTRLKEAGQ